MRRLLLLLLVLACLPLRAAELYRLDAGNTHVSLGVRLFGVPWVSARFEQILGELVPGQQARVEVTIQTASLQCDNSRWNERLPWPAWFDADRYPQILYRSERIDFDAAGGAVVDGRLTLHGQTRHLVLSVNRCRCLPDAHATGCDQAIAEHSHGSGTGSDAGSVSDSAQ